MLRALLALLLLANLLFFAWTRGALSPLAAAPRHGEREPERLAAQVRPEAIIVLTSATAARVKSDAEAAAKPGCLEAGPYGDAEVEAASAALIQAGVPEGSWRRESGAPAGAWLVYAGRYPDANARRAREAELKRMNIGFEIIDAPAEFAPGFVLSRHASRDAAQVAFATLAATAGEDLRDVRVISLPTAGSAQHWLRAADPSADTAARLFSAGGFRPCAAR